MHTVMLMPCHNNTMPMRNNTGNFQYKQSINSSVTDPHFILPNVGYLHNSTVFQIAIERKPLKTLIPNNQVIYLTQSQK
jgi:hypothetical protein